MSVGTLYPHIEKPDGDAARLVKHPRIRVAQIAMDYLAHGWSPEEICRQYPLLTPAEVHAAMGYFYDNTAEIDEEIRQEMVGVQESRKQISPSPFVQRMKAEGHL